MDPCQIVLCSCPDEAEARRIARTLVEGKLAAAVNIVAMGSVYRWRGAVTDASEHLLIIKAGQARYRSIEQQILSMHSYETPGIVAVPLADGFGPYLTWMAAAGTT